MYGLVLAPSVLLYALWDCIPEPLGSGKKEERSRCTCLHTLTQYVHTYSPQRHGVHYCSGTPQCGVAPSIVGEGLEGVVVWGLRIVCQNRRAPNVDTLLQLRNIRWNTKILRR